MNEDGSPAGHPASGHPGYGMPAAVNQPYPPAPAYPAYPPSPQPGGHPVYGPGPVEHPQGTTVLVLGILSLVVGVTAPFAWYYGVRTEREMRASGLVYSNSSHVQIGKVLGIVGTVLLGLSVLAVVGYLVFVFSILGVLIGTTGG